MKNLVAVLLFVCVATGVSGQAGTPRTEFTVTLNNANVRLKPGESADVLMNVHRSKGFAKSKASFGISSGLPKGITVSFDEGGTMAEHVTVKIIATPEATEGKYLIILSSTLQNKKKGATLNLTVGSASETSTVDSR